jgi:DNA-binding NarL/FixJ family response regulator
MSKGTVRILLADSNHMACRLLADALEQDPSFKVVASAVTNSGLLDSLRQNQLDVVLIAAYLQDGPLSGFARLPQLREEFPTLPCIMLLDRTEPDLVVDAFRAGARGVFARSDSDVAMLCKCIHRVVEGQIWADSTQLHILLEAFASSADRPEQPRDRGLSLLTTREEHVVRLVAEGMGNREIAQSLNLSEHTVKNYLFRIFEKLGLSNRVELVLYAIARLNQQQDEPPFRSSSLKSEPVAALPGRA